MPRKKTGSAPKEKTESKRKKKETALLPQRQRVLGLYKYHTFQPAKGETIAQFYKKPRTYYFMYKGKSNRGQIEGVGDSDELVAHIYSALASLEMTHAQKVTGIDFGDFLPTGRVQESLDIEENYATLISFTKSLLETKDGDSPLLDLVFFNPANIDTILKKYGIHEALDIADVQRRNTLIQDQLKALTTDIDNQLNAYSDKIQYVKNIEANLLKIYNNGTAETQFDPKKVYRSMKSSFFGMMRTATGTIGELLAVRIAQQGLLGFYEDMEQKLGKRLPQYQKRAGNVFMGGALTERTAKQTKLQKADATYLMEFTKYQPGGNPPTGSLSVALKVPVSIKSSPSQNPKTIQILTSKANLGKTIPERVLAGLINLRLTYTTKFMAASAALIADYAFAQKIRQRPLFLQKITPSGVSFFFFFEIYSYFYRMAQAGASSDKLPSLKDVQYSYTVNMNNPWRYINEFYYDIRYPANGIADTDLGRDFYRKMPVEVFTKRGQVEKGLYAGFDKGDRYNPELQSPYMAYKVVGAKARSGRISFLSGVQTPTPFYEEVKFKTE